ncbi:hypothetical protein HGH92_08840 [Chitinophaga varians]|uniref:T9SS C-terminal target domain-containing protein n=1 Tax=Chitinophaga varians TaxID=2202339 RepID=A0A847RU53_9BACT|nr:hypothetical protein [Chitinophaga varians]NLR64408.1 hypothetical protein [Chitinophaga varians]
MTKNYVLGLLAVASLAACSKKDDNNTTPPPSNNSDTVYVRGKISASQTWSKNKVYKLRGYVYVDAPAVLTVEAGTQIISTRDSAGVLVVYKGAQINANGTADNPIVFTSGHTDKKPGDLGGIILVGSATGNGNHAVIEGGVDGDHKAFGGTNDADNSGTMQYVRIEYAGKAVSQDDEVNGLSLYTVGNKTTLHHIQVVNGLDDAFEFFGGTVNAKYLIAYNTADDDFDMDDAYKGMIQFAVSVKQPSFTDPKGASGDVSNNFEVDNTNPANKPITTTPTTFPVLSNFTAIGPNNATGTSAAYGYGARWRRGCQFILGNSIIMGSQKEAMRVDDNVTMGFYNDGTSGVKNSLLHSSSANVFSTANSGAAVLLTVDQLSALVTGRDATQVFLAANAGDIKLKDPFNNKTPDLAPQTGSPALAGAKFEGKLADAFFDKVAYRGAIDPANDWTKAKWVAWDRVVVTQ